MFAVVHVVFGIAIDRVTMFFFFQAEDGIRDLTVTGVQTCALPIFLRTSTQTINFRVGKIGTADRTPSSVVAWSRDTKLATVYAPAQILNGGTERGFITAEKGSHEISVPRACLCTPIHIRQRGRISALSCVFHHSQKGIRPCA